MSKSTGSSKNRTGPKDESKRKSKAVGSKSGGNEGVGKRRERKVDVRNVPLSWWRERWSDRSIRRQFIENFIHVRDAFNGNRLVPMILNDVQVDLHESASGRDCILKSRRQGLSRYWLAAYLSNAVVNS